MLDTGIKLHKAWLFYRLENVFLFLFFTLYFTNNWLDLKKKKRKKPKAPNPEPQPG